MNQITSWQNVMSGEILDLGKITSFDDNLTFCLIFFHQTSICNICSNFCWRELCAVIIYAGNLIKKTNWWKCTNNSEAWSTNFGQLLELRSSSCDCFYCALHSRILNRQKSSWKVTQTPPDGCVPVPTRFIIPYVRPCCRSVFYQSRELTW